MDEGTAETLYLPRQQIERDRRREKEKRDNAVLSIKAFASRNDKDDEWISNILEYLGLENGNLSID